MRHSSLLLVLGLFGCMEQGFSEVDDNAGGEGPEIDVSPVLLEYGTLGQDDDAVVKAFTVSSVGATDLSILGMELDGAAVGSFSIITDDTSFRLPAGAEKEIEVAFSPMGANDQLARVLIESDDPESDIVVVELVGDGAVPELSITPDPLDFTESYVGCEHSDVLEFENVGTDTLTIDAIDWSADAAFATGLWPTLPYSLAPGESFNVSVDFLPLSETEFSGSLSVRSNEPMGQRDHETVGSGKYAGPYTESWEIPVDPPSDIMFAVDQSCSMDDDQRNLANNFGTFINELSDYSNDWQIIVANDDDGCNSTGILTPTTPGFENTFGNAVSQGGGSYTESLLTVGARAIEASNGGCNNGFVREDAMLHVILVSDEPEQSSYYGGGDWSALTQRIIDAKGSASNVKISAIAGPVPGGCGSADPGTGYSEAVAATGGVFLSICDNWASASNLALLAEASINQDTFELSRMPVEETIEVVVNGQSISNWSYDSMENAVVVGENAVPEEGDEVDITYAGYVECD